MAGTEGYDSCYSLSVENSSSDPYCSGAWGVTALDKGWFDIEDNKIQFKNDSAVPSAEEITSVPNPATFSSAAGFVSMGARIKYDAGSTDKKIEVKFPEFIEHKFQLYGGDLSPFSEMPALEPSLGDELCVGDASCDFYIDFSADSPFFYDSSDDYSQFSSNTLSELYSIKKDNIFGGKTKFYKTSEEVSKSLVGGNQYYIGEISETDPNGDTVNTFSRNSGNASNCYDVEQLVISNDVKDLICFGESGNNPFIARGGIIEYKKEYSSEFEKEPSEGGGSAGSGEGKCYDGVILSQAKRTRESTGEATITDSHTFSIHCLGEISYNINNDTDNKSGSLVLGANADTGAYIYAKKLSSKTPEMNELVLDTYPPVGASVPSRCYSGATLQDDEDKKEYVCGGSHPPKSQCFISTTCFLQSRV